MGRLLTAHARERAEAMPLEKRNWPKRPPLAFCHHGQDQITPLRCLVLCVGSQRSVPGTEQHSVELVCKAQSQVLAMLPVDTSLGGGQEVARGHSRAEE